MSWQAYVDQNLLAPGAVTAAGIYDLDGNPWAYSQGFALQVAEVASVSAQMRSCPHCVAGEDCVIAEPRHAQQPRAGSVSTFTNPGRIRIDVPAEARRAHAQVCALLLGSPAGARPAADAGCSAVRD